MIERDIQKMYNEDGNVTMCPTADWVQPVNLGTGAERKIQKELCTSSDQLRLKFFLIRY